MSRRLAAAAVVTLLGGGLLSGCTASSQPAPGGSGSVPSQSLTPLPTITQPAVSNDLDASDAPTAPAVSAGQRQFAAANGAANVDPAAVLEAGTATCDRIALLVQIDAGALKQAIVDGDVPDTETAVPLLCPDYLPQLVDAKSGFEDGTAPVGKGADHVAPGAYLAAGPSPSCVAVVTDADGKAVARSTKVSAKKVRNGAPMKLVVPEGAAVVTSKGCRAWLPTATAGS